MKKILITAAATLLTVAAFAQGTVNFANASTTAGLTGDHNVRFGPTVSAPLVAGALVSSNYAGADLTGLRATLYYGVGISDLSQMAQAVGTTGATFKNSTSATAGSWFTKTATLETVPLGTTANLIVVVWDSKLSADPRSGAAMAGIWGASAPFAYTPPAGSTPAPAEFLMTGLQPFTIGIVPEPTSFALAGLGAAALLIFRRRK
jgi:hypothetical protein